jgi:hypothetical protein
MDKLSTEALSSAEKANITSSNFNRQITPNPLAFIWKLAANLSALLGRPNPANFARLDNHRAQNFTFRATTTQHLSPRHDPIPFFPDVRLQGLRQQRQCG